MYSNYKLLFANGGLENKLRRLLVVFGAFQYVLNSKTLLAGTSDYFTEFLAHSVQDFILKLCIM